MGLVCPYPGAQVSQAELDQNVLNVLTEFPNCGYKRMTGFLFNTGLRVQQDRIRESMRRVDPEGVLLRTLEMTVIHRRHYQVEGPLALWHIDGHHKLIRQVWLFYFEEPRYPSLLNDID